MLKSLLPLRFAHYIRKLKSARTKPTKVALFRAVTGGDRQAYRLLENLLRNFHIASCAQLGRRSIKNIHTYGSGFNFYLYKKICPTNYNLPQTIQKLYNTFQKNFITQFSRTFKRDIWIYTWRNTYIIFKFLYQ